MFWGPLDVKTKMTSSYEIVKTSDEKYDNATKIVSLFTYPVIVLCTTNPPPSPSTNPCARPSPYIMIMNKLITWLQYDTLQWISTYTKTNHWRKCIIMLCDYYPVLYYIDNVTYLNISVSNIPIIPRHGLFCVCLQPIRACVTMQRRPWLSGRIHSMIPARLPNAL